MPKSTSPASAAGASWLLDTGPLVALLSQRDDAHTRCLEIFESFTGRLITCEAVLTEGMHLLGRNPKGSRACLDFFLRGGALLVPMTAARLVRCRALMAKYESVPMDFADAALVTMAEDFELGQIFTLDRRGFGVYRWQKTRRFAMIP